MTSQAFHICSATLYQRFFFLTCTVTFITFKLAYRTASRTSMRFVQFLLNGSNRLGVELKDGGDIVDLNAGSKSLPCDMKTFIEQGQQSIQAAKRSAQVFSLFIFDKTLLSFFFFQLSYSQSLKINIEIEQERYKGLLIFMRVGILAELHHHHHHLVYLPAPIQL